MELLDLSIAQRVQRRLVRLSLGPAGLRPLGRLFARHAGWPLPGGARILLENPDEYIQRQVITQGVYEPNLAFVIGNLSQPGRTCVDVGANIGQHTLIAASRGARVVAFEPLPRLAAKLARSVRGNRLENRVAVVVSAVGAAPGKATLHVNKRGDDGSHSLLPGVEAAEVDLLTVNVTTLDLETERLQLTPDLVKIDVEGYEAAVLDGAGKVLTSTSPPVWIVETADRLADQLQETAASVIQRFRQAGYEIWELPEFDPPKRVEAAVTGRLTNHLATHPRGALHADVVSILQRLRRP